MKHYIYTLLSIVAFTQCKDNIEITEECPSLTKPMTSYSTDIYPIVAKTCAIPQCHTTDFDYGNFNLFQDVKLRADNGKLRFMIETHQMPHGFTEGPKYLTNCEIETMKKWLNEGAQNN